MVIVLLTQTFFVLVMLLAPWDWLTEFMEVVSVDLSRKEETMFRVYLMLIPVIHLILAVGIEVSVVQFHTIKK